MDIIKLKHRIRKCLFQAIEPVNSCFTQSNKFYNQQLIVLITRDPLQCLFFFTFMCCTDYYKINCGNSYNSVLEESGNNTSSPSLLSEPLQGSWPVNVLLLKRFFATTIIADYCELIQKSHQQLCGCQEDLSGEMHIGNSKVGRINHDSLESGIGNESTNAP